MSSDKQNYPDNSLEDILKDLEERFLPKKEEPHFRPKKSGINFARFTQNQIVGGLTLMLLIVGGATASYLSMRSTELRQRASTAYPTCGAGSVGNCPDGVAAGSGCNVNGFPGTCRNSETSPACTCELNSGPTMTPVCLQEGAACANQGGNDPCCSPLSCEIVGPNNATKCVAPGTVIPTRTPTRTVTPGGPTVVIPTNTSVPPTIPPATNTQVPPTNVPATNTPVRTNTPGGPTSTRTLTPTRTPTPTTAINSCSFLVAGENVTDGNQPPYTASMFSYIRAAAPNTTSGYGTTFTVSGTQLKSSYAGIFYAAGTTSTITNDGPELDEYLNLGGNLLILTDDTSRTVPAGQFLAKYGVSFASSTYGVANYPIYPFSNTYSGNLGQTQMFFVGPSYVRATITPLVRSSTCQYSLVNNNTVYCIWMRTELLSGGVIDVISNYGAFGGGSQTLLGTGASTVPPHVTKLAKTLTTNYCTSTTPTPTNTPAIGPTCNSIAMSYGGSTEPQRPPKIGDNVTFTCASIANATRYQFRIFQNGNLFATINPSANGARVSEPFPINQLGHYDAQCRACATIDDASCQQWESL